MNRVFCFLGAVLFLVTHEGFADSKAVVYKTYIQPDNISLERGNIMIAHKGEWIRVPNLSSDQRGYFIASNDPWYAPWICPVCKEVNNFYNIVCWRCNRPR